MSKNKMKNNEAEEKWTVGTLYQTIIEEIQETKDEYSPRVNCCLGDMSEILKKYQNKSDVTKFAILEVLLRYQDQKLEKDYQGYITVTQIDPEEDWEDDDSDYDCADTPMLFS